MGKAPAAVQAQQPGNRLSMRDFNRLAQFVNEYSGIKLPESKHTMLEGRLRRRLRATGIQTFDAYCRYVFEEGGMESEFVHLVDTVTTNKTDFFREPKHFEYMLATALPALVQDGVSKIRSWSAACSTGAEPYTMAMILDAFFESRRAGSYSILATDLSTDVLEKAWLGIYPADHATPATEAVWFYDLRTNMPSFGKTNALTAAHFEEFERLFGPDPLGGSAREEGGETSRWRKLTREQIAARGDNLDWTWLRDESGDPEDQMTEPDEIAAAIIGHLRAALEEIEGLSEELDAAPLVEAAE